MLRFIGLSILVLPLLPSGAWAQTVARPGDDQLTCAQMSDEAATLSASFGEDSPGIFGRVAGVAKAGAAMLVPGAGLAIAGADAVTQPGRQTEARRDQAERDRWNYLNGLYAGRGCNDDPTPVAVAPAPPAAQQTIAVNAPAVSVEQARNESGPNH
jgi:hypothetical protein